LPKWDRNRREVVRVALDFSNDKHTINARVWFRDDDDVLKPGKTGITLAVRHLPALANAMGKALATAGDLGLINDIARPPSHPNTRHDLSDRFRTFSSWRSRRTRCASGNRSFHRVWHWRRREALQDLTACRQARETLRHLGFELLESGDHVIVRNLADASIVLASGPSDPYRSCDASKSWRNGVGADMTSLLGSPC
jgi:Transcriptional Coactivator p15 (PC4)